MYLLNQLFLKCLTMTFIAEWGDRSQLATIVLAGINNVYGVIVGEWHKSSYRGLNICPQEAVWATQSALGQRCCSG